MEPRGRAGNSGERPGPAPRAGAVWRLGSLGLQLPVGLWSTQWTTGCGPTRTRGSTLRRSPRATA
eukprot:13094715-Alexandrium_andersonii.AAC.1